MPAEFKNIYLEHFHIIKKSGSTDFTKFHLRNLLPRKIINSLFRLFKFDQ